MFATSLSCRVRADSLKNPSLLLSHASVWHNHCHHPPPSFFLNFATPLNVPLQGQGFVCFSWAHSSQQRMTWTGRDRREEKRREEKRREEKRREGPFCLYPLPVAVATYRQHFRRNQVSVFVAHGILFTIPVRNVQCRSDRKRKLVCM